ncbi:MAG: hypothetical protein OXD44_09030 [Gammaproteobacteria bacterium]|nr:hypothetical protein [Gammaproteobacteria bacterium]
METGPSTMIGTDMPDRAMVISFRELMTLKTGNTYSTCTAALSDQACATAALIRVSA